MTMTETHTLTGELEAVGGGQWRWTCSCGKTGVCGPALPAAARRLAVNAVAGHRRAERLRSGATQFGGGGQ